jgi:hypothetical protein
MPMIDVYAPTGVFDDKHAVAQRLAGSLMAIEEIPDIAMFCDTTAAFIHELPADAIDDRPLRGAAEPGPALVLRGRLTHGFDREGKYYEWERGPTYFGGP